MLDIEKIVNERVPSIVETVVLYFPRVLLAIVLLVVGFWLIKKIVAYLKRFITTNRISEEIKPMLISIISIALKVGLILAALGVLGIKTTAFVASLAALSFAVGMAFQGALGHLASGLMIFLFRPYRVGNYIMVQEQEGFVQDIQLFNTVIKNLDNELILIPNGNIFGDVIVNSSGYENVRSSFSVHIPYEEEFARVQKILKDALYSTELVLKEPEAFVGIKEFDTHTIILDVKFYSYIKDKEKAYFLATQAVKKALGENGIQMAYSEGIELGKIGK